eukprot:scaffold101990_cov47-Phaeocystis_antarctica.AAC.2
MMLGIALHSSRSHSPPPIAFAASITHGQSAVASSITLRDSSCSRSSSSQRSSRPLASPSSSHAHALSPWPHPPPGLVARMRRRNELVRGIGPNSPWSSSTAEPSSVLSSSVLSTILTTRGRLLGAVGCTLGTAGRCTLGTYGSRTQPLPSTSRQRTPSFLRGRGLTLSAMCV